MAPPSGGTHHGRDSNSPPGAPSRGGRWPARQRPMRWNWHPRRNPTLVQLRPSPPAPRHPSASGGWAAWCGPGPGRTASPYRLAPAGLVLATGSTVVERIAQTAGAKSAVPNSRLPAGYAAPPPRVMDLPPLRHTGPRGSSSPILAPGTGARGLSAVYGPFPQTTGPRELGPGLHRWSLVAAIALGHPRRASFQRPEAGFEVVGEGAGGRQDEEVRRRVGGGPDDEGAHAVRGKTACPAQGGRRRTPRRDTSTGRPQRTEKSTRWQRITTVHYTIRSTIRQPHIRDTPTADEPSWSSAGALLSQRLLRTGPAERRPDGSRPARITSSSPSTTTGQCARITGSHRRPPT